MKSLLKLMLALLVGVCTASPAASQETFGAINGVVTDATGAAVVGAKVTVTNLDKGVVVREVVSGDDGFYAVPKLVIGRYSVTVEATGFKKATVAGIELNVQEIYRADVKLELGSVTSVVTVEASALQVETESASSGSLITGTQIRELS